MQGHLFFEDSLEIAHVARCRLRILCCLTGLGRRLELLRFEGTGLNGRWRDTLTAAESAEYERRAEAELGAECARWLATGEGIG